MISNFFKKYQILLLKLEKKMNSFAISVQGYLRLGLLVGLKYQKKIILFLIILFERHLK